MEKKLNKCSRRPYFFKAGGLSLLLPAVILAGAVFMLFGCTRNNASEAVPQCEITAPLDSLFSTVFKSSQDPGAVVMVMRGDDIVYSRGFGMARLDTKKPMTDSTVLNICSATKTYVTAGIMKLVEEGRLDLDTPLSEFFPNFGNPIFRRVTIRHVLSHTSGLPDLRPRTETEWEDYVKKFPETFFTKAPDYMLYARGEELTRFYEKLDTFAFEPGSHFEYANPPFMLLSRVIRQVTGESFVKWMKREIFDPAGLVETAFYEPDAVSDNFAHGYVPTGSRQLEYTPFISEDGRWQEYDYGEAPFFATRADMGLYTTPREFMKWQRYLHGGNVISQASMDTVCTPVIPTGLSLSNISYALGQYVQNRPGMPRKIFHNTSNGGFAIFEGGYPEQEIFYLIFSNRPDWNRLQLARKTDSILLAHGWLVPVDTLPNVQK